MTFTDQSPFDVRVDWGPHGALALSDCRVFVVVDVLSFSTCVSVATARGAIVYPFRAKDDSAAAFAKERGALLAGPRGAGYSLSASSMFPIPAGTRLVLPSPNGATISLEAGSRGRTFAGCLRNRAAVAGRISRSGGPIGVIAAGERWPDGTLRVAFEDLVGAGAIVALLAGTRSPEAAAALAAFEATGGRLHEAVLACASGRELCERGFEEDVAHATALDADGTAPELVDGAFR